MSDYQDEMDYIEEQRRKYEKWVKEKSIKLELGCTYVQKTYSWSEDHYKIVFMDDVVAVGVQVYCGIYKSTTRGCGERELFLAKTGEKYQDKRLNYALIKKIS